MTHSQAKKVKCNFYFREEISKQICFAETVNPYFRTTPTPCLKIKVVADYTASTLCPRSSQLRANLANYNFFYISSLKMTFLLIIIVKVYIS